MTKRAAARPMRVLAVALAALLSLPLVGSIAPPLPPDAAEGGPYNGLDAWHPGMGYWAPIGRGLAFVEGKGVAFQTLDPVLMPTDDSLGRIYQFPNCPALRPVLGDDTPLVDSPMRQIIDLVLPSCGVQPTSEAHVFAMRPLHQTKRLMYVNAPIVPQPYAEWADEQLFNGPPYRPRVTAWFEGQETRFITYDVSWLPPAAGSAFPGHNVDLFILSGDVVFERGVTRLSLFNGAPLDVRAPSNPMVPTLGTHRAYSPVWKATCIVPEDDPVCGAFRGPRFDQCVTIAACASTEGTMLVRPPDFLFVNCPIVGVDLAGDGRLSEFPDEFVFPDLWRTSGWVGAL
jgi:hypothetical protein